MKQNTIITVCYFILMVVVIVMLNNGGSLTGKKHGETAGHDTKVASEPSGDPAAYKEALDPDSEAAKIASINKALDAIAPSLKTLGEGDVKNPLASKISPDAALVKLQDGNIRFAKGESIHPNLDAKRRLLAATENQAKHAFATVFTCSDSRIPVEAIFDAGVMDIFTVRVAGNVCDVDETGSIEFGVTHVNTPVVVVLGHTQCGAVTAVSQSLQGHGNLLEGNIPKLVDNIQPAVKKAMELNPDIKGDDIIPIAIEENVWTAIEELLVKSPVTRDFVAKGYIKLVGAVYDIGTGNVNWLPEQKTLEILSTIPAS